MQPLHYRPARDVGEVGTQLALAVIATALCLEFALDEVERALGPIDEDQATRPKREDLSGELGSDRTRRRR